MNLATLSLTVALVANVSGHRLELIRWLDPLSHECEVARDGARFNFAKAYNFALDQSERDGTRWFKFALECPGDTLDWPHEGVVVLTLKSGAQAVSRDIMAVSPQPEMTPYHLGHGPLRSDTLHLLPWSNWGRSAWLLVGFPPTPHFEVSDVSAIAVARADTLAGNRRGLR